MNYQRDLIVRRRTAAADGVVVLDLADPHGDDLPAWEPGAHMRHAAQACREALSQFTTGWQDRWLRLRDLRKVCANLAQQEYVWPAGALLRVCALWP
jgi:hypothetical protein